MRSNRMFTTAALVAVMLVVTVLMVQPAQAGPGVNVLNAQFPRFQEASNVIHIFVFNDAGRPGQPPAVVDEGQTVILGFEWAADSIADLYANYIDNPDHNLTLSVDGGAAFSVKYLYQEPFIAATRSGPRWKWDHDGDGPGDGDGDGIGDWAGPVSFFRYAATGLSVGTHTFLFTAYDGGSVSDSDLITVEVVAP